MTGEVVADADFAVELSAVAAVAAAAASDNLRSKTLLALINWDSKLGTVDGEFFVLPYFSIRASNEDADDVAVFDDFKVDVDVVAGLTVVDLCRSWYRRAWMSSMVSECERFCLLRSSVRGSMIRSPVLRCDVASSSSSTFTVRRSRRLRAFAACSAERDLTPVAACSSSLDVTAAAVRLPVEDVCIPLSG